MTWEEKQWYLALVEGGAEAIEAAEFLLIPWETVKRELDEDPFFANRWVKAQQERLKKENTRPKPAAPKLVVDLPRGRPELEKKLAVLKRLEDQKDLERSRSCDCDYYHGSLTPMQRGRPAEPEPKPPGEVVDLAEWRRKRGR